jgi:hypothetical protein
MAYKGHETVVAIHNYVDEKGAKGARLNEKALFEIFSWAGVGYSNKSLKAFHIKESPPQGVYLQLLPDQKYARTKLGLEGLDTRFDVFPAYAPTSTGDAPQPQFVFRFRLPPNWPRPKEEQWVLWDVGRQGVTLTSALQELCFPELYQGPRDQKNGCLGIRLRLPTHSYNVMHLRMRAPEAEEQGSKTENPTVWFDERRRPFFQFCLD